MKVESKVLARLGPIPRWCGSRRCVDSLDEMYRRAMKGAQDALRRVSSDRGRRKGVPA